MTLIQHAIIRCLYIDSYIIKDLSNSDLVYMLNTLEINLIATITHATSQPHLRLIIPTSLGLQLVTGTYNYHIGTLRDLSHRDRFHTLEIN